MQQTEHCLKWTIRTTDGQYITNIKAWDADEAIQTSGIEPSKIRRWYPFPTGIILTEAELDAQRARLAELRNRPKKRRRTR